LRAFCSSRKGAHHALRFIPIPRSREGRDAGSDGFADWPVFPLPDQRLLRTDCLRPSGQQIANPGFDARINAFAMRHFFQ